MTAMVGDDFTIWLNVTKNDLTKLLDRNYHKKEGMTTVSTHKYKLHS